MSDLMMVKKDTVDVVADKVRQFQEKGELQFPANYSPENAMKSAWLTLQSTVDRNKKPVLDACTNNSIANALLDMVVQGLNPAKKQGYFIAYGPNLVFQRSYFGTMAVCKQVTGASNIYGQVVYKGDDFEYEIKGASKIVTKHKQKIENVGNDIVAAYGVVEFPDGRVHSDVMTMDQIKKAWTKSKMNPESKTSTHSEFAEEMTKKTVINRTCKALINSSNDSNLLLQHFNKAEETMQEQEVSEEIEQKANTEYIDVEHEIREDDPEPEQEPTVKEDGNSETLSPINSDNETKQEPGF